MPVKKIPITEITLRIHYLIWKYFHETCILWQNVLLDKRTPVLLKTERSQQLTVWTGDQTVLTQVRPLAIKASWKVYTIFTFKIGKLETRSPLQAMKKTFFSDDLLVSEKRSNLSENVIQSYLINKIS